MEQNDRLINLYNFYVLLNKFHCGIKFYTLTNINFYHEETQRQKFRWRCKTFVTYLPT